MELSATPNFKLTNVRAELCSKRFLLPQCSNLCFSDLASRCAVAKGFIRGDSFLVDSSIATGPPARIGRLYYGDNLDIMRRYLKDESVESAAFGFQVGLDERRIVWIILQVQDLGRGFHF
jgi:hypothetical protein